MRLPTIFVSLFIAASASVPAAAMPLSAAPSLHATTAPAIETVQYRGPHARYSAPAGRHDPYGHGSSDIYDWSHWSPSHHPGWPCVSGDNSTTSAYPTWEVRPYCR
jgi:hypothetical protein